MSTVHRKLRVLDYGTSP